MSAVSNLQWRWAAGVSLTFYAWQEEPFVLVFQPASGDTHLLDRLSGEVLCLLGCQPRTMQEVWQQLLAQTGLAAEELPLDRLEKILGQLEQLELIERVSA